MSAHAPSDGPRFAVLAEGRFTIEAAKTASSAIRYLPDRVSCILDSETAGRTASEVLGYGGEIPIVGTVEAALALEPAPEALLIGVATRGGLIPDGWRPALRTAIDAGLSVWNGLHDFLSDDPELAAAAARRGVELVDLRKPPDELPVAAGRAAATDAFRVLTVGSDCNVGKMTAALEIRRTLIERGLRAGFAASGQTGILVAGHGIAVDAVVSDFMAGAAEAITIEAGRDADVVLVEGQGSLLHPGYSGVALGLLHGSMPQAMVLCAMPGRPRIYGGKCDWVKIPTLHEVVALYEAAAEWITPPTPSRVVGVCLATWDLDEGEARRAVDEAAQVTGLPATDPIRYGADEIADAILEARAADAARDVDRDAATDVDRDAARDVGGSTG